MLDPNDETHSSDEGSTGSVTFIIPVTHPIPQDESLYLFGATYPDYGSNARDQREDSIVEYPERIARTADIRIFSTGDTSQETMSGITSSSSLESSEALERVAACAAFWKSVGADTLIYVCSLGASLVANGLIIRFAGLNPLTSTLIFGGTGALGYSNTQILFNSLIKPPKDHVPKDRRKSYALISKYALLPFSFVIKSGVTGTILSTIGDTDIGTQQAVSSATSPLIGPITTAVRMGIRTCYQGSYVLADDTPDVGEAFTRAYSTEPNEFDSERPYRFGTTRDMFAKLFGVTASTLMLTYSGGFNIETYCAPTDSFNSSMPFNSTNMSQECFGGNMTFMFRELGISVGYAIGFLVVEPLFSAVTNRLYDYFYPATESEDGSNVEELDDSSEV